jgi:protein SCO1/2
MNKKIVWAGLISFLIVGLAVLVNLFFAQPANFRGTAYNNPFPNAPGIELQKADGIKFRLADMQGRITLLFFGYTSCTDVCPITLANMNDALKKIEGDSARVKVVFITVDPNRDTPDKIQNYVTHFNPAFIGLSGSMEQLQPIWKDYGVFREIAPGGTATDYTVNHTARITLIDAEGKMRLSYAAQTASDDIANDLNILLGQK